MAVANVVPTVSTNVVDDVPKTRPGGYEEVRETRKTNVVLPNNVAVANDTWSIRCQIIFYFFSAGGLGRDIFLKQIKLGRLLRTSCVVIVGHGGKFKADSEALIEQWLW